jgi:ribosome-associated translation inhibitor RaiA
MQVPLDITFQNSEPSEAIRSEVEKQAKRLEKFHDRITSCHVTVIAPTMKRRHGDLFKIDICVAMPQHKDILVSKAHGDAPEHEHVMVAIKDAFAAALKQKRSRTCARATWSRQTRRLSQPRFLQAK